MYDSLLLKELGIWKRKRRRKRRRGRLNNRSSSSVVELGLSVAS
jgi:hypothetical protein